MNCMYPFEYRFLTDLMDQADLIRNVVLAGHLYHGKVPSLVLLARYDKVCLH